MAAPDLASVIRALLNYGAPPAEVGAALIAAINNASLPTNFSKVLIGTPPASTDNALTVDAFGFDGTSPGQGRAAMLFGKPNTYTVEVVGSATTGQSYGVLITAGSNTSDFALNINQKGPGNTLAALRGDGCLEMNGGGITYSGNTVVDATTMQAAIQLAKAFISGGQLNLYAASNAFFDGTNYKYNTVASNTALLYAQNSNSAIGHQFYGAAAGTGGNVITFNEMFRINVAQAAPILQGYSVTNNNLQDMSPDNTSVTGTLTGCTTAPTNTVTFRRIGALVLCQCSTVSATSSSTGLGLSLSIPSVFRPAGTRLCPVSAGAVLDAGAAVSDVAVQVTSAGTTLTFTRNGNSAGFTNTATSKGINQAFITCWIAGV